MPFNFDLSRSNKEKTESIQYYNSTDTYLTNVTLFAERAEYFNDYACKTWFHFFINQFRTISSKLIGYRVLSHQYPKKTQSPKILGTIVSKPDTKLNTHKFTKKNINEKQTDSFC
jgi:hypothetical protein